jgi:hypothetical protein
MVLYADQLDGAQCQVPGCTHQDHAVLFLNSHCHPRQGVECAYVRAERLLRITCIRCKRLIAEVAVAYSALHVN